MQKPIRAKCPNYGSLDTIKWGRCSGHQRYRCQGCGGSFTLRRKDVSQSNRFIWFKWWILGKQTIPQIAELSGYSSGQLYRWFDEYLDRYSQWHIQRREEVNLLIDDTLFPNKMYLIVYRNETVKATLFYRLTDEEWEEEIRENLENIQSAGIEIESVTSDGGRGIIKAVKQTCPHAVRQRCLVHIQRECLTWIT